jgi:4-hydroxybenzoate polyprenyltransferase
VQQGATANAGASLGRAALVAAGDIKLSHSVFALPFAVLGALLARRADEGARDTLIKLGLVVACMVLARTWAMLVNRLADARFDAANPRTAGRAVASGRLRARDGWVLAGLCAAGFMGVCALFGATFANWWPLALGAPVLGWLALYSYAKRFTALCHVLLGTALAISPIAAALAVEPTRALSAPHLLLAGFVTLWVAGFDVVYALQDEAFDRGAGLRSIPARVGARASAWVARAMHAGALACLVLCARSDPRLGALSLAACTLAGALLILEHVVLVRRGLAGLPLAFFTLNGVLSVVVGGLMGADVLT